MNSFKQDIADFLVREARLAPEDAFALVETPRDPTMGDFSVPCFRLAKSLKKDPKRVAADLAESFSSTDRVERAEATGPYVNFRLNRPAFFEAVLADPAAESDEGKGRTIVLDYASPNISKHLAYHHLRSPSIGFSLKRIFTHLGHPTVGINHLGDWGTTHGKLIAAWKRWGEGIDLSEDAVTKLNELYVRYNQEGDDKEGQEWFKRLEAGDAEARALWSRFREVSLAEHQAVYDLIGFTFDEVRGESDYVDELDQVVDRVGETGLAVESDGALVVKLEDEDMPPFFLRKADGATVYGTRDLAAVFHRFESYEFHRCLYVVDMAQSLYFKQFFSVLRRMGLPWADRVEHVAFGAVRFGGKRTGTRTGNVVLLRDVVEEAIERIRSVIEEKNADLPEKDEVARMVGVGALVFADLSSRRVKDFDFEWEDVLNFDGHTGPYVQYTHARCASILRKAGDLPAGADFALLTLPDEWEIVKLLGAFPDRVRNAARDSEPSTIAQYLLLLSEAFSRYYNLGNQAPEMKVLAPEPEIAAARTALVAGVRAVLKKGLWLLGIEAPEEM